MMEKERVPWIDAAKGVSICLVVLLHASTVTGEHTSALLSQVNKHFVFLRMPLFFFISGAFAARVLRARWSELLTHRIANLLWVYVVWSTIAYLSIDLPQQVLRHEALTASPLFRIFIEPPRTLWFIYALAIVTAAARLLLVLPGWIGLVLLLALYLWSASSGDWSVQIPVTDRVMRLALFFYAGVLSRDFVLQWAPRFGRLWPLFAASYAVGAFALFRSTLLSNGFVTLVCSLLGLAAALTFAYAVGRNTLGSALSAFGRNSLYIYVMHRIVVAYAAGVLIYAGVNINAPISLLFWALAVTLPIAAAALLMKCRLDVLFTHPFPRSTRDRENSPQLSPGVGAHSAERSAS